MSELWVSSHVCTLRELWVQAGAFRTLRFNKAFNVDKSRNHKRLPLQQWHRSRQFVRMPERLLKAFLLLTVALGQLSQAQPGEGGGTPPPPAPPQLQVGSTIWKLPHSNSNFPRKNYTDWYSLICIECKPHDCFTLMCISDNYFLRLPLQCYHCSWVILFFTQCYHCSSLPGEESSGEWTDIFQQIWNTFNDDSGWFFPWYPPMSVPEKKTAHYSTNT